MDDEIIMEADALPVKKQFVTRALYPYGALACKEMGIVPASEEVAQEEAHQAYHEIMAAVGSWIDFAMVRARWYVQAHDALMAADEPVPERDLEAHLAAFALSIMVDERLAR